MLQKAARFALTEIDAIPETAGPVEEHEAIQWAIAPVQRLAERFDIGLSCYALSGLSAQLKERVSAWLDGDGLHCLLQPMEIAA
ncbi:hypothetical protein XI03_07685 [Bradyrhizobium sp. CCBAU 65884]|uniref:hypothetical protein n=1 Tax=Bradyrhizobium sp. CCBAU 65884 TaxID=722477 RepID=UPI0023052217|nr:hypothetical protein [Bradyrhizobium sp. CCBAU 65884]MDA9474388.1 hypothetical protein [Bradyrhizobium sp. CCBAU 65884]